MRAVSIPSSTSTCAQVSASTSYIASDIILYPPATTKTTPVNGTYATWTNQTVFPPYTTYGFGNTPPGDYVLKFACWNRDTPAAGGNSSYADLYDASTLTWQLGYTAGTPWAQTLGGDVYASGTLTSYIPSGATPRYFDLAPSGGTAGVVTYGTSYDFASGAQDKGPSYVSAPGWLAQDTSATTDYYALMFHRFGSPTVADYTGTTTFSTIPSSPPKNGSAYYVNGDLTIDTNPWSVGSGQRIVVLVSGKLTINKPINITPGGFLAFIVRGDISVDTTVGTTAASVTPVVEGVYITSPTGTFHTGTSTTAAARRFVGHCISQHLVQRSRDKLSIPFFCINSL